MSPKFNVALQKTKLVPAKVKKMLLHLVEFMERQNHSLGSRFLC